MRCYLCTNHLYELGGKRYFHPDEIWYAEKPEGVVSVDMRTRPDIFRHSSMGRETEPIWNASRMFYGYYYLPAYHYVPETGGLVAIESWKEPWARAMLRRRVIDKDIKTLGVTHETELKHLRLAIIELAQGKPGAAVADLQGLSDAIESKIAAHPKASDATEQECREENYEYNAWLMRERARPKEERHEGPDHVDR